MLQNCYSRCCLRVPQQCYLCYKIITLIFKMTHPVDYMHSGTHSTPHSILEHSHHNTCPALFRLNSMTINYSSLYPPSLLRSSLPLLVCLPSKHGNFVEWHPDFIIYPYLILHPHCWHSRRGEKLSLLVEIDNTNCFMKGWTFILADRWSS